MANHTVTTSKHATLAGTAADQVTIGAAAAGQRFRFVEVYNWHATERLYWTYSPSGTAPTTAVGGADDTLVVPPLSPLAIPIPATSVLVVSLVGNNNPYSVQGIPG